MTKIEQAIPASGPGQAVRGGEPRSKGPGEVASTGAASPAPPVVGIDLDTYKITLCRLGNSDVAWETLTLRRSSQSGRDNEWKALRAVPGAIGHAELLRVPGLVYIERATGQNRSSDYPLGMMFGAIVASLLALGRHVEVIDLQEWKREVTAATGITRRDGRPGNGQVPKPVANDCCRKLLDRDRRRLGRVEHGRSVLTPDQLDAFGVAFGARAMSERGSVLL